MKYIQALILIMTKSLFKETHIFPDDIVINILGFIKQNGPIILSYDFKQKKFIDKEDPYYTICKTMVQQDGTLLRHVLSQFQTEELCKLAVQENGNAIFYVRKDLKTEEFCKLAVQQNGCALRYMYYLQTEEICKLAVQQNGLALQYVRKDLQTEEICKLAV